MLKYKLPLLLLVMILLIVNHSPLSAQVVTVSDGDPNCFGNGIDFLLTGTNTAGYNVYQSGTNSGTLEIYNRNGQWRLGYDDPDPSKELIFNFADYNSTPNPPNSSVVNWVTTQAGIDDGCPADITVAGSGTQSELGGDPCDASGGDSDGDGVCDDSDSCPGSDDNQNQDGDDLPDGCDPNPTVFDGVVVDDGTCLTSTAGEDLLFVDNGLDATGRKTYRNANTSRRDAELLYNTATERWEIRSVLEPGFVYYFNDFASLPNAPTSTARGWQIGSRNSCSFVPLVSGSEAQGNLGCSVGLASVMVTDVSNGNGGDGTITLRSDSPRASDRFSIDGPVQRTNTSGDFAGLPGGDYVVLVRDDRFPQGDCQDTDDAFVFDRALPHALVSFDAFAAAKTNVIRWTTANEVDVQWHDVERSPNGSGNWTTIIRDRATANASGGHEYVVYDTKPVPSAYYRLHSYDYDGHEQLGPSVFVQRDTPAETFRIFPNPVDAFLTVTTLANDKTERFRLTDARGRTLRQIDLPAGQRVIEIRTGDLPAGFYVLTDGRQFTRFVKK
ncbi:T9SS type A sorting domain-containing protein [Neolewinella antarctica]|uniref:T9SS type A sorting domain-containing protein n=1 Tax=Neolewinella antarctica TaxID=442734 RepID=A0ABX0XC68_9BACT|nr:T9SS type A sorting domain-containing protein [Neolewinella antarctica]NJC26850.1 hypothetical protein [Neolewinella antarctica]